MYRSADEQRVRQMQAYLAHGLAATQAARAALDEETDRSVTAASTQPAAGGGEPTPADA